MTNSDVPSNTDFPSNKSINSVSPQNNPAAEHKEPPSRPTTPNVPPAEERNNHGEHCRPDQTPWWKYAIELGGVLVVVAYTLVANRQLGVMNGQLAQMMTQTEVAIAQVAPVLTLNNSVNAYHYVSNGSPMIRFEVAFRNDGKNLAYAAIVAYRAQLRAEAPTDAMYVFRENEFVHLAPDVLPIFSGHDGDLVYISPPPTLTYAAEEVKNRRLYIWGRVGCRFSLDRIKVDPRKFCAYVGANDIVNAPFGETGKGIGYVGPYHQCD